MPILHVHLDMLVTYFKPNVGSQTVSLTENISALIPIGNGVDLVINLKYS